MKRGTGWVKAVSTLLVGAAGLFLVFGARFISAGNTSEAITVVATALTMLSVAYWLFSQEAV